MTRSTTAATPLHEQLLLASALLALVVLASWPGARATDGALGWLPLWLVAAPLSAWAAVRWARARDAAGDLAALQRRPRATVHVLSRGLPHAGAVPDVRRAA